MNPSNQIANYESILLDFANKHYKTQAEKELFQEQLLKPGIDYVELLSVLLYQLIITKAPRSTVEEFFDMPQAVLVDSRITEKDYTPLHVAVEVGNFDVIKYLIANHARLDLENEEGNTPLHVAVEVGNVDVIEYLIDNGARLDLENKEGNTPLHVAVEVGNFEVIKYLIANRARLDLTNKEGNTPLHVAVEVGNLDVIKCLIDNGARLDLTNKEGNTPLHVALENGFIELAKVLIQQYKVHCWYVDSSCNNILHVVARGGHVDVLQLLREQCPDKFNDAQNTTNTDGCTPLDLARQEQKFSVVQYLTPPEAFTKSLSAELPSNIHNVSSSKNFKSCIIL